MTARLPGSLLYLRVCGGGSADADILPHGHVEEVVVLRNKGNLVGVCLLGDPTNICPAKADAAARHVPKRGDKPCDSALATAAGADEGDKTVLRDHHGNPVQYLFLLIGKAHIFQLQIVSGRRSALCRAIHLRRVQNGTHLAENGAHGTEIVRIAHHGDDGCDHTHREDDDGHKVPGAQ